MKEISLQERKQIQINMLKEIASFCETHGITYSLSYGSLLGAVRHKGYIPWDDDIDLMMPLPDMLRLKKEFSSENLSFCDIDTQPGYELDFPRIVDKRTCKKQGKWEYSYGIAVDIYVVINLPECAAKEKEFFTKLNELENYRHKLLSWRRRLIHHFPLMVFPGLKSAIKKVADFEYYYTPYASTTKYYVVAGPVSQKDILLFEGDLFAKMIRLQFEDQLLLCISRYDEFLKQTYGNYMQYPPESERHPYHNAVYYWR